MYIEFFENFKIFKVIFFNFLLVYEVPGLLKKLRGTGGIRFHLIPSKSDHGSPSYDQKTIFEFYKSCNF